MASTLTGAAVSYYRMRIVFGAVVVGIIGFGLASTGMDMLHLWRQPPPEVPPPVPNPSPPPTLGASLAVLMLGLAIGVLGTVGGIIAYRDPNPSLNYRVGGRNGVNFQIST